MNGYELSRAWFDFSFDNPEKIKPSHSAVYFFAIEHCNRLGWKEKFGFPSQMVMEAIGIKNWRTYSGVLKDLVEFGFIEMIETSKNQYSANIIAIVKNTKAPTKATTKALDKALQKHSTKQGQSTVSINKQDNKEQVTIKNPLSEQSSDVADWLKEADPFYLNICEWFYNSLIQLDLVKKNTRWKSKSWYDGFKRLLTIDGVNYETQFRPVINFYLINYGKDFCPIAESPASVRTKWKKLEAYYNNNNKKPMGSTRV